MYINPFLAGILATVFAEIVILVALGVFAAVKRVRHGN